MITVWEVIAAGVFAFLALSVWGSLTRTKQRTHPAVQKRLDDEEVNLLLRNELRKVVAATAKAGTPTEDLWAFVAHKALTDIEPGEGVPANEVWTDDRLRVAIDAVYHWAERTR